MAEGNLSGRVDADVASAAFDLQEVAIQDDEGPVGLKSKRPAGADRQQLAFAAHKAIFQANLGAGPRRLWLHLHDVSGV